MTHLRRGGTATHWRLPTFSPYRDFAPFQKRRRAPPAFCYSDWDWYLHWVFFPSPASAPL